MSLIHSWFTYTEAGYRAMSIHTYENVDPSTRKGASLPSGVPYSFIPSIHTLSLLFTALDFMGVLPESPTPFLFHSATHKEQ